MPNAKKASQSSLRLTQTFDEVGAEYVRWVQSRHLASGVSFAQMRLLGILYTEGPQIMNELSKDLGVTPRYVTKLVASLEADGMVTKTPHATDRRATVIALTTRGSSLGVLMSGPHQEAVAKLFDCLTERERTTLLSLLGKIRLELERLSPPA